MSYFLEKIKSFPGFYCQVSIGKELVTEFACPIETEKEDIWKKPGYFAFEIEKKIIWPLSGILPEPDWPDAIELNLASKEKRKKFVPFAFAQKLIS